MDKNKQTKSVQNSVISSRNRISTIMNNAGKVGENIKNIGQGDYSLILNGPIDRQVTSNSVNSSVVSTVSNKLKVDIYQQSGSGEFTQNDLKVTRNDVIQYKVVLTNVGTVNLYNLKMEDILSINLKYQGKPTATVGSATWTDTSGEQEGVGGTVTWTGITSLAPSGTATLTFSVLATTVGANIINQAKAGYALQADGPIERLVPSNSINTTIVAAPTDKITVEKFQRISSAGGVFTKGSLDVAKNEIIEYKIVVTNISSDIVYKLATNDLLGNNLKFEGTPVASVGSATWVGTEGQPGGTVQWTGIASLAANTVATLTFTVKAVTTGTNIINKAETVYAVTEAGTADTTVSSNNVSVNILEIILPQLSVQKLQRISSADGQFTGDKLDILVNEIIEYKITVTNIGTKPLYNISTSDILSQNFKYNGTPNASIGVASWSDTSGLPNGVGGTITWTGIDVLQPNAEATLIFKVTALTTGNNISNIANTGYADAQTAEVYRTIPSNTVQANILANLTNTITIDKFQRIANVGADFSKDTINFVNSELVEYKIVITNIGTTTLYDIDFKDILDNQLQYQQTVNATVGTVTWTDTSGLPGKAGGTITWTGIDQIDAKGTATLIFVVKPLV